MLCEVIVVVVVSHVKIRTYDELSRLKTFDERFDYLKLNGLVGEETFGFDRYLNQLFYKSPEWLDVRNEVILRDNGCDLGVDGYEIHGPIIVHHMNPISENDIKKRTDILLDSNYLVLTAHQTHNAVHYGSKEILIREPITRTKHDTCPWRH